MATLTERLAIVVDANAGKAIAEFKQLGAATKGIGGDIGRAGGLVQKFGGTLGAIGQAAGPAAAVGLVGAAFGKFATDGVQAFASLASEVAEFRRVAGGSAEDASKMVAAFRSVGIDASTAAGAVFQLEKRLGANSDKLATFGIQAQKNAKGQTDMTATILTVADAYKRIQDPIQRAALLTAAFGKQGTTLIPLLGKSREEIERFFEAAGKHGQILTDADLKQARDYKLAMRDLSEAFKGLEIQAGKTLVPFLTSLAHTTEGAVGLIGTLQDALHVPDPESGHQGLGGWLDALIHHDGQTKKTTESTHHLGDAMGEIGTLLGGFKTNAEEAADGIADLDKALSSAADAEHSLADAHRNTIDAQADYNELLKQTAVDAEKVADAQRSLAEATRSVGHARREQADAKREFDKASAAAGILGTDTALEAKQEAADNLADATDSLASALDRQKSAQADLDKARAGDPDYQEKLAAAKQKVADATFAESQRALASATAHDAEAKALKDNADQAQALYDKYQALIQQHPEVALALAGNIAALGPALPAPAPPPPAPAILGPPVPDRGPVNITNHFNYPADPAQIGRNIIWNLN